ncbi:ACP S-malonyltransferase [Halobacteria archaeon AArc-m2/3/4]|uniref:[acyl-carrier-protein] S-malonyltransferase n=1 Tax=Natronoglomus mannanivorans TaxID=2979990 RepID=A0ABT2QLR6_9EURY|nr:ACP S-malonyltransferase [Halobacteria archaeon AArc-m2/3/4]
MSDDRFRFDVPTAFVFPGQGSQKPGMGTPFYEGSARARDELERLDEAVDFDLLDQCLEGDADALRRTRTTQPTVFATGIAAHAAVVERLGCVPQYVTGHSLGQYTALAAAGGLDPEAGVALVRRRGEVMERACEDVSGRMVAALFVSPEAVTRVCADDDEVDVAGFNGPRQTVISGTESAVAAVVGTLRDTTSGPCRFVDLEVSEPFHSPAMAPAEATFADELRACSLADGLQSAVVSDTTANVYEAPECVVGDLESQITATIDWTGVVDTLRERGVEQYVEFPPSGTLGTLVAESHPDARIVTLESPADIAEIVR